MDLTRRAVVGGGAATVVLGCAGVGPASTTPTPSAPSAPGEPATLFLPSRAPSKGRVLVEQPAWLRDAGGLYCPTPRSAGAVLLTFAGDIAEALPNRISHFRELPALLPAARRYGTSILYVVDWYEPKAGDPPEDGVWNKGDYLPRTAMGGTAALRDGIAAVHAAGGRVVLYVDLFVVSKQSQVGLAHGAAWSIRTESARDDLFPRDDEMCPANPPMADYFAAVAARVVGDYGADGLFHDSYGSQRGWKCLEPAHGHALGRGEVFDEGCTALVARLRDVITAARPDAVLLCEGAELPDLYRSVAASLDWGLHELVDRWVWSHPGRVFTAGWSLDDLHQIVALGQKLAFGGDGWFEPPPERSAVAWMDKAAPTPLRDRKNEKFRRLWAEDVFRVLHRWRNAGIVLGLPVPSLDAVTPRRWDGDELFQSHEGLIGAMAACREAAARLDAALASAPSLPSAEDPVRRCCAAAAQLAPLAAGTTPVRCDDGTVPHTVAWRFGTAAVTVVNVGGTSATVTLDAPAGPHRDVMDSRTELTSRVDIGAHALRVFLPA